MSAGILHPVVSRSVPRSDELNNELTQPPARVFGSAKSSCPFADHMGVSKDLSRQYLILFNAFVDRHSQFDNHQRN